MLARVRRAPAWKVVAAYCAAVTAIVAVAELAGSRAAAGGLTVVVLALLAVALYGRPDGQGWAIFAALIVVGFPLNLLAWAPGVELAAYVAGAMAFAVLGFDPRPATATATATARESANAPTR